VHDIRIARRGSQGVVIFKVADGERVVSVARLPEVAEENGNGEADEPGDASPDEPAPDEPPDSPGTPDENGNEGDET
jgi:DNA gyrase subunit A